MVGVGAKLSRTSDSSPVISSRSPRKNRGSDSCWSSGGVGPPLRNRFEPGGRSGQRRYTDSRRTPGREAWETVG